MSKRIISVGVAIALMLLTAALTFSVTMFYAENKFNDRVSNIKEREAMYSKIAEIDTVIRQNFVGEIDEELLMDKIAEGFIAGLNDRYSSYFTAEEYAEHLNSNDGTSIGIGVTVQQDETGYIKIVSVRENSPAQQADLRANDLIVKVDGVSVSVDNYTEVLNSMRGEEGTSVELVIRRDTRELDPITIVRRQYDIVSIEYDLMSGGIGYIRIIEFNNNTVAQFKKALNALQAEYIGGIIFDVRNNPGGTVQSVSEILDLLVPEGPIISATYSDGRTEIMETSDATELNLPMVVLTNENTASAAELFTQALKDYEKAQSVGVRTFGKGVMQTTKKLKDGSALNLTVATYNPPKSPNYDGIGVAPDFEVALAQELQAKLFNGLKEEEDVQLTKALELAQTLIKQQQNAAE